MSVRTPEGHEDGEGDSGVVVEQIAGPRGAAHAAQLPIITHFITQRTHGEVQMLITHLLTERETNTQTFINIY